jgi:DNA-directed RNA polymerase specialized sigma24 family protein
MAAIPQSWEAFARLQRKLSVTTMTSIDAAIDSALNVVHQPGFRPETFGTPELTRIAASAARKDRHRARLRRIYRDDLLDGAELDDEGEVDGGAKSLDEAVHAQRELARLPTTMRECDWDLLLCVASGDSYNDLAIEFGSSSAALRSRVCRLRQTAARN